MYLNYVGEICFSKAIYCQEQFLIEKQNKLQQKNQTSFFFSTVGS